MSQKDTLPTDSAASPPKLEDQTEQSMKALGNFIETITPWLLSFGNWIFGGLIAFNMVVVASLLTVGPVHPAILISVTIFVCALPLNLTGLFLVKLTQDMKDFAFDDLMQQAFKAADFPNAEAYFPDKETSNKRRTSVTLRHSVWIAELSIVLSVIGMVAALWYMAWWIGIVFLVMVIVSILLFMYIISRTFPPQSEAEKELRRQYAEQQRAKRKSAK